MIANVMFTIPLLQANMLELQNGQKDQFASQLLESC